jgi:hypothetical protein
VMSNININMQKNYFVVAQDRKGQER